jgi:hypothetical protein
MKKVFYGIEITNSPHDKFFVTGVKRKGSVVVLYDTFATSLFNIAESTLKGKCAVLVINNDEVLLKKSIG